MNTWPPRRTMWASMTLRQVGHRERVKPKNAASRSRLAGTASMAATIEQVGGQLQARKETRLTARSRDRIVETSPPAVDSRRRGGRDQRGEETCHQVDDVMHPQVDGRGH